MPGLERLSEAGARLPDRIGPALAALAAAGLTDPGPELTAMIRVALAHRSYLGETSNRQPGLSLRHIDALDMAGAALMDRTIAIEAYRRHHADPDATRGGMHDEVVGLRVLFPDWAGNLPWLMPSALVGRANTAPSLALRSEATMRLVKQLFGVLGLAGQAPVVRNLLADMIGGSGPVRRAVHARTLLTSIVPEPTLRFDYTVTGPAHGTTCAAVVSDPQGRSGSGTGPGKAAAANAACLDFLRKHHPDRLEQAASPAIPRPAAPPPRPLQQYAAHSATVATICQLFALPAEARGLVSQALIHGSWAHENGTALAEHGQRDHRLLAYLGSHLVRDEHVQAATRRILATPEPPATANLVPELALSASAFDLTGLRDGLLLGAGHADADELPAEMRARTFQAVVAAVLLARDCPPSLADGWPPRWQPAWDLLAPPPVAAEAEPVPAVPTVAPRQRLDELVGQLALVVDYYVTTDGPAHELVHRATVELHSPALDRSFTVPGGPAGSKAASIAKAAAPIVLTAEATRDGLPVQPRDRELARFLLLHTAATFDGSVRQRRTWLRNRLFGMHLVGEPERLLAWARWADEVLGEQRAELPVERITRALVDVLLRQPGRHPPPPGPNAVIDTDGTLAGCVRVAQSMSDSKTRSPTSPLTESNSTSSVL